MEFLHNSDTLVLVASHLAPIYRELEPPYLEICAVLSDGCPHGYQHYVENYPGIEAHPESLSEIIILLGAEPFFKNKKQVGLIHYRRIFSLNPNESNVQNYTQDLRTRYSLAGAEAKFLNSYKNMIVIPKPMSFESSVYDNFILGHAPLERALDVACLAFNESVKDIFGVVDSKSDLENTQHLYPWNMWIGSPDFYNEWVSLLLPVIKALDEILASLPHHGYQNRWSGFISERLFSVYIDLCRSANRWDFVERPVIFFEDIAFAERDIAVTEIEVMRKSKSWSTTRFLRMWDQISRRLLLSPKK